MKLSTSAYSRGRVGTIAAVLAMVALTATDLSTDLICGAGIVTWLAVSWFLSANKDKDVF